MAINRHYNDYATESVKGPQPMTPFTDEELDYFEHLILAKKKEAMDEIDRLQKYLAQEREESSNDTAYSYHMADAGTDTMHLENVYIMIERQKTLIGYLDRALDRIKNKTYGICRVTGSPISKERLEAIPHTEISVAAKLQEQRR